MMASLKIGNGLPMIGPGDDVGVPPLPVVGDLGKNYDSATPDGYCPACKEKGKFKALKTYRISFQESISLCEDLQCIYPLGAKSLGNLISPDAEDCNTANKPQKRKSFETSCKDVPLLANSKKTRKHIATGGEQIVNSKYGAAHDEASPAFPDNSSHQDPIRAADFLEQKETLDADNVDMIVEEDPAAVDVPGPAGLLPHSECSEVEMPSESKGVPLYQTLCVQWKNTQALCWLDCILSALVHLEGLKNTVTALCSKEKCVFWRLFGKYNQANKLLCTSHVGGIEGGDYKKNTSEIFADIEACLNEVRDEIFTKLQPQLRCTLGEMESPVFAFPLLLKIEPHIEKLFTCSFSWGFKCSQCGYQYQNRCTKSLVTFTNVIPEWHPLNAAHFGPCNSCNAKSQIRKMALEIVAPIFMVHFVEGLPQNDLQHYAFHFEGGFYQVTSVIQYQASSHFITWILDADGSWLECDDLKGPCAERHKKFEVPASEIHIVIWERKMFPVTDKETTCLPLRKPNNDHAVEEEEPAPPALRPVGEATTVGAASVTCPTHLPVAPQTLTQDKAVLHGLIENILPLTLEGTSQETVSIFQIDSKDFLLEDKSVAETTDLLKANTAQSQDSAAASLLSNPGGEQLTHAQFVGSGLPSQGVSADPQSAQLDAQDTHAQFVGSGFPSRGVSADPQSAQLDAQDTHAQFVGSGFPSRGVSADPQSAQLDAQDTHAQFVGSGFPSQGVSAVPQSAQLDAQDTHAQFVGSGFPSQGVSAVPQSAQLDAQDTHAQFVGSGFPSQGVSAVPQSARLDAQGTVVLKSVSNAPATYVPTPVQEGKSVETENGSQLHFLPLKTETLRPEQHTAPQASNPTQREAAYSRTVPARPAQGQPVKETQKKPFVGSWVKGLLSRGAALIPPCVSAHHRNTITDLQPSIKGANNFDGFKTKGTCRKSNWASKKACRWVDEPLPASSSPPGPPPASSSAALPHASGNVASQPCKIQESTSHVAHLNHSLHRNGHGISSTNCGDVGGNQIHKLRLKLLKKLKAKKKKLAALMSSPQTVTPPSESLEPGSDPCGSPNDCESIEDLLNELQHQIDIADNKARSTVPSDTSYNSQSHEEILAELLSPTTVSTEFSKSVEPDFRYLEMGGDSPTPAPGELNTHLKQDHNYCSPTKKTQCEVQSDSLATNPCTKALNSESPMKTDIFDEFFSISSLTSLANDTLDLPHFDECLFENC